MSETNTKNGNSPFAFPSGEEVYDKIMGSIEPELVTKNLKTLDAPYANETEDEKKKRYARYTKAFAKYKVQYKEWMTKLKNAVKVYKKAMIKVAEEQAQHEEDAMLSNLESQISLA